MNNKGFTMVEIIAVIAILGLLAIITTPAYNSISSNIKTRNYESKKNTIESETLSYVEKYLKDEVYDGLKEDESGNLISNKYCFSTGYLIQNGIIHSDDEEGEYILNDETGDKYDDTKKAYVVVTYDNDEFKLNATFTPEELDDCDKKFEGE